MTFNSVIPAEVVDAYCATHYSFRSGGLRIHFRIGQTCRAIADMVGRGGGGGAFYITAFNPLGSRAAAQVNRTASRKLLTALNERGSERYCAIGTDPGGERPAEPGFTVFGLSRVAAEDLGRSFFQ